MGPFEICRLAAIPNRYNLLTSCDQQVTHTHTHTHAQYVHLLTYITILGNTGIPVFFFLMVYYRPIFQYRASLVSRWHMATVMLKEASLLISEQYQQTIPVHMKKL
jgi:hypothetical protein